MKTPPEPNPMSNDLSTRIERHDFANPAALAESLAQSVADDLRAGHLQVVLPEFPLATTAISAVMPQRRQVPPRVRAFVDFLVDAFGDDPPWERGLQG